MAPLLRLRICYWKAKTGAELSEIKKKRMEEEQAGENELSGKQQLETDHVLTYPVLGVEGDESLLQEVGDLELEDTDDGADDSPADAGQTEGRTRGPTATATVAVLIGF